MEPLTTISLGVVLKAPVEEFLRKITGPVADDIGAMLKERLSAFRTRNAERAITRAHDLLVTRNRRPRSVPLRTLLPILDGASIEDDAELSELWAALLAHAADDETDFIPPIFPSILRQLSPFDARVLNWLAERLTPETQALEVGLGTEDKSYNWGVHRSGLKEIGLSDTQVEVSINTLVALGQVEVEPAVRQTGNDSYELTTMQRLRLTALGQRFVASLQPDDSV